MPSLAPLFRASFAAAIALSAAVLAPEAQAQTPALTLTPPATPAPACAPIAAVPVNITTSGHYCLVASLTAPATGNVAIIVSATDVTIDLRGHALVGSSGMIHGIYANETGSAGNLVVKNGTIRGFRRSISSVGSLTVEDMLLARPTEFGIQGGAATIRRVHVDTATNPVPIATQLTGISVNYGTVTDSRVDVFARAGSTTTQAVAVTGIACGTSCRIERNDVSIRADSNVAAPGSKGLWLSVYGHATGNVIHGAQTGVYAAIPAKVYARNNVIDGTLN